MKSIIKVFTFSCIVLLAGCATYVEPPFGPHVSTIAGSMNRKTVYTWNSAEVLEIDGKTLGMKMSISSKFNILPGRHWIRVHAEFNNGFGYLPKESDFRIRFLVKPDINYVARSSASSKKIEAWVENSVTKEKVSDVKSADFHAAPVYVTPIMMPAR